MIYFKMIEKKKEKKKKKKISVKLMMADRKKNLGHWPLFPFLGSKKIYLKTKSESLVSDRWKAKSRYMSSLKSYIFKRGWLEHWRSLTFYIAGVTNFFFSFGKLL